MEKPVLLSLSPPLLKAIIRPPRNWLGSSKVGFVSSRLLEIPYDGIYIKMINFREAVESEIKSENDVKKMILVCVLMGWTSDRKRMNS
jgi:hypothetical protein